MGDVVEFPGNHTSEPFERYIGRCGQPNDLTGEACAEPAGHEGGHVTATDAHGNATAWPL